MSAATAVERTWSRDYITLMRCDAGDAWMPEVESQIAAWLRRQKRIDIDPRNDGDFLNNRCRGSLRRLDNGRTHDLRLSMVEDSPQGTWTTELLAHDEPGGADWIFLSVTNDRQNFVDVPNIAKYLMQVLPLGDGAIRYLDKPRFRSVADLDRLRSALQSPDRNGLMFVAGTDDTMPVARFIKKVEDWSRQVYGLAQVVVLDPAATQAFSETVGAAFGVLPWTIRTYRPHVAFDNPLDARRHRFVGTNSLGLKPDASIRRLLGDIARNHAAGHEVPIEVQRVRRRFERVENRRLIDAIVTPPALPEPLPTPPQAPLTQPNAAEAVQPSGSGDDHPKLALVRRILDLKEVTEAGLRDIAARLSQGRRQREQIASEFKRTIDALEDRIDLLENQGRGLLRVVEDEQLEHEFTRLDLDKRNERIAWMESRLRVANDYGFTHEAMPAEFELDRPRSFAGLLERIAVTSGVEFTGDEDIVTRLNDVDTNESALRTAWEAVCALTDYVRARLEIGWSQGIDRYLDDTPTGYATFPPGKFAATETRATMQAFGAERIFPVPSAVRPSECVEMQAHFKLARIGMVSPRMHIYDAFHQDQTIYIGYIGPHLTNTQS